MGYKRRRVRRWVDGDSGFFSDGTHFRLAGVRAQERNQFGAKRATRAAAGMTSRTRGWVRSHTVARDRYGREIVKMSNRDGSINRRLVDKGYGGKGR